MNIAGKTALVTGSARRIGREIVLELARRGGRIAVHYRSSGKDAASTVSEIQEAGAEAQQFQADLTSQGEVEALVHDVHARFGSIDILVNNASVFSAGNLADTTSKLWDTQMDTNAKAPFFVAQAVSGVMRAQTHGKIINIADPAGEVIWPEYLPYSISKAALLAVTRGLARAVAPGVQVNAVAPGPVHFPETYTSDQKARAINRTLLKRAGTSEDVVRAVIFLIENDYITGEVLHVDGGRHLL